MTRRSSIVLNLAIAIAFPVLGAALSIWWYNNSARPIFKDPDPRVIEYVRTTSDIEHLRKFTLLQIRGEKAVGEDANEMLDSGVNVLVSLLVFTAFVALLNLVYMCREMQKEPGAPDRWWDKLL